MIKEDANTEHATAVDGNRRRIVVLRVQRNLGNAAMMSTLTNTIRTRKFMMDLWRSIFTKKDGQNASQIVSKWITIHVTTMDAIVLAVLNITIKK